MLLSYRIPGTGMVSRGPACRHPIPKVRFCKRGDRVLNRAVPFSEVLTRVAAPGQIRCLVRHAEVPDTEMVLREELAAQAETPDLFLIRARGISPCAEELGRLVFLKLMPLVIRANGAVLPADLPVLFRILGNILCGVYHDEWCVHRGIIGLLSDWSSDQEEEKKPSGFFDLRLVIRS